MKGRVAKVVLSTIIMVSLMAPYMIYATENNIAEGTEVAVNNDVIDKNNGTVTDNQGFIKENNGTVTTNTADENPDADYKQTGGIDVNKGTVVTNASTGYIDTNRGNVTTNNGKIEFVEGGNGDSPTVGTNNNYIGMVNVGGTVTENASGAQIFNNMGTVTTNNGFIDGNATQPTQVGNEKGTVVTNNGEIRNNNAIVSSNSGVIRQNDSKGSVTNTSTGVVDVNNGGIVTGGTVKINLSHPEKVTSADVQKQMYQVISGKIGSLNWQDNSTAGHYYEDQSSSSQVQLYLWNEGTLIIKPADASKEFKSVTTSDGATITKRADGMYEITGITKDINLSVLFVGESVPVKVEVKKDDEKKEDKKEDKTTTVAVVSTPAVATLTVGAPVPTTPSATVLALAPVINPSALYGAVDLKGVPTSIVVTNTDNKVMRTASETVITQALAASGIVREEVHVGYTGRVTTASQGSVMTLNNVVSQNNIKYGTDIYVAFKNPVTGSMMYVVPKLNADGSISFEVPFSNCEFSVVYAEKISLEKQLKLEEANKK